MGIIGKGDAISNSFKKLFKCLYFHFYKALDTKYFSLLNLMVASAFTSLIHLKVNIISPERYKLKNLEINH